MPGSNHRAQKWWKESVVYQIYPASFKDSNNDGWGDIPGIISKCDYLKELGVDVVWLSPVYKSPQVDMGYDISDYEDIDPVYGSLTEAEKLIEELAKRDMKLMMDLVVNHTSDQHQWFLQSRSSKEPSNPKRDWYIWQPAKHDRDGNRLPPNNWTSQLKKGSSAWTWDEATQEYYLSIFTPEQPDLNWENVEVREAVHDVLRYWLDKGVAGFRMDVINLISKVPGFPDGDVVDEESEYQPGHQHFANGPRLHEFLREINEVLSEYDTITVGEMPFVDDEDEILRIVQPERKELNMIFIFDILTVDMAPPGSGRTVKAFNRSKIREVMAKWQKVMIERDGWNSLYIECHDGPRSVSRYTDDDDKVVDGSSTTRELGAKLLALMMTTLSGTLFIFQGQELGMKNIPSSWSIDEYKDVLSQTHYQKAATSETPTESIRICMEDLQKRARDNCRVPMQWSSESNAGFCTDQGRPWMRVNEDDAQICNADDQVSQASSVWRYWQSSLRFRKEHAETFVYGNFSLIGEGLHDDNNPVFSYRRWSECDNFMVVLNFSGETRQWKVPRDLRIASWASENYGGVPVADSETLTLRPWEGLLGRS